MRTKAVLARAFNRRLRITDDHDPNYGKLFGNRFEWMQLNNLKVSPAVYDRILASRQIPAEIGVRTDQRLAIFIPFRDRDAHLEALLPRLRAQLDAQHIDHRIFVVEQADEKLFNRAKLLNVGTTVAGNDFDYYCFHDVDLLPADCCYGCPSAPLRLFSTIRTSAGNRRFSNVYFSGAISVPREDFERANGFSNEFWHWGKEDDNFLLRLLLTGAHPAIDTRGVFDELDDSSNRSTLSRKAGARPDAAEIRKLREVNRKRQALAATGNLDAAADGLSTLSYRLVSRITRPDYELLQVSL